MDNIEWLIGQYRIEHDNRVGLQCTVASLVRQKEHLVLDNNRLVSALEEIYEADTDHDIKWACEVARKALKG